ASNPRLRVGGWSWAPTRAIEPWPSEATLRLLPVPHEGDLRQLADALRVRLRLGDGSHGPILLPPPAHQCLRIAGVDAGKLHSQRRGKVRAAGSVLTMRAPHRLRHDPVDQVQGFELLGGN